MTRILRVALVIGFCIDAFVGLVCLFAPALVQPLFDIPVKEALAIELAGPEFIVAALVYAVAFSDPKRFRPLLWLCALDQFFAVILPVVGVALGTLPASFKIVAPIPLSALLVVVFIMAAVRDTTRGEPA